MNEIFSACKHCELNGEQCKTSMAEYECDYSLLKRIFEDKELSFDKIYNNIKKATDYTADEKMRKELKCLKFEYEHLRGIYDSQVHINDCSKESELLYRGRIEGLKEAIKILAHKEQEDEIETQKQTL